MWTDDEGQPRTKEEALEHLRQAEEELESQLENTRHLRRLLEKGEEPAVDTSFLSFDAALDHGYDRTGPRDWSWTKDR